MLFDPREIVGEFGLDEAGCLVRPAGGPELFVPTVVPGNSREGLAGVRLQRAVVPAGLGAEADRDSLAKTRIDQAGRDGRVD